VTVRTSSISPVTLVLLVGALWLRPAFLTAQRPADHIALGMSAQELHDPRTALQHYQAALQQDSSNYEANWRGAMTLGTLGEQVPGSKNAERDSLYSQAVRYARRAVKSNPAGADGHFALAASLGRASLGLGKKDRIRQAGEIRSEALRTLALNPRHDGAYHILGRWNAEIMRLSGFSRFFAKRFLGAGVFKEASWSQATYYMEKAVQLDPGRIYHHLELAEIYSDQKRYKDASAQLHVVDSLPPREIMDSVYKRQAATLQRGLAKR
jgi:regulator of microtubule dynamics protein 3